MNLFIIKEYIKRIKKEDIYNYALNIGITLTPQEIDTLYYYLKNYYRPFLTGNQATQYSLLEEIKSQVKPTTASKLDELYQQYKNKI